MTATRSEAVAGILSSSERFSESAIGPLEEHVRSQLANGSYDFEANRTLVKLYQLVPHLCSPEVLAVVLAKATMARPAGDATALRFICPEVLAEATGVLRRLGSCEERLEQSDFAGFWEVARTTEGDVAVVDLVPGFSEAVRAFILGLLADTFATVSVELLASVLGIGLDKAAALAASPPTDSPLAPSTDPGKVNFKPNARNQPQKQRRDDSVGIDALLSLYNIDDDVFRPRAAA